MLTRLTSSGDHAVPTLSTLQWSRAAEDFVDKLGLVCSRVIALSHPKESGLRPDSPWIVVTVVSALDCFSHQNPESPASPHWAWLSNECATDELQLADGYRVETSTGYLTEIANTSAAQFMQHTQHFHLQLSWNRWRRRYLIGSVVLHLHLRSS